MNDKLGSLADFSLGLANRRQEMRGWKERQAGVFIPLDPSCSATV